MSVPETRRVVNHQVAQLLGRSEAFRSLPESKRAQIFRDTAAIVDVLADGDDDNPLSRGLAEATPPPAFQAQAMNQGITAIRRLVNEVNFPAFVAELIRGTFQAIVDASIQQMEAYGELVKGVVMSLNDFRNEQVSPNQGREHLLEKYPGVFQMDFSGNQGGQLTLNPEADLESIDFGSELGITNVSDIDDETVETKLVPAARDSIARSRQRLLSTMVMLGIHRIIVTDGEINARVRFRFSASDQMTSHVVHRDYANLGTSVSEVNVSETENEVGEKRYAVDESGRNRLSSVTGAKRYTTGAYRYDERPIIQLTSMGTTDTQGAISAQGDMRGEVKIRFKSETFPLDKMLDSDQLAQIQSAGRGAPATTAAARSGAATKGSGA